MFIEWKKNNIVIAAIYFYLFSFSFIPATKDRVCCCQHRASWVQCCGDTSLQELIRPLLKSTVNQQKAILSSASLKSTMLSTNCTLAIEIVCCSIASWIATRSSSRICKMQQTKWWVLKCGTTIWRWPLDCVTWSYTRLDGRARN